MSALTGCEPIANSPAVSPHVLQRVPILVLNVHSRCNCRCVMCDIWKRTETEELTHAALSRHLSNFREMGVEWIVLSGGEPLMHSDFVGVAKLFRSVGIRLTLLTTGLLLSKYADSVARSFDEVIVSVDGPRDVHDNIRRVSGAFDRIHDGITALRQYTTAQAIRARTTVQKDNFRYLVETIAAVRELGFRSISFLAADLTSTAFNRELVWPVPRQDQVGLSRDEINILREEIEQVILRYGADIASGFIAESSEKLRRIVHHFEAHLGLRRPSSPTCNAPWVSAVVEANGDVRPCFFHPAIGNLNDEPFMDVVNGPRAIAFRESLDVPSNPTCQRCVCSLYRP
jgi:MoaA/NifB/PqqE/SkfB family radical SAM enzyme